jgi:hypothetical protein
MPAASPATPCSLILLPGENKVNRPAAANVRPWSPEVAKEVGIRAASVFQRVPEDAEPGGVQLAGRQGAVVVSTLVK